MPFLSWFTHAASIKRYRALGLAFVLCSTAPWPAQAQVLQAGDANENYEFNSGDLVVVFTAGVYKTGSAANWAQGDWDGAPGGAAGSPPPGDGFFDEHDIVAAYYTGLYETGPYPGSGPVVPAPGPAPILGGGTSGDGQTSLIYDAFTGEVAVDPPVGVDLTTIHLISASGTFDGSPVQNLGGLFDVDEDDSVLKLDPGGFGAISFGNIATPGLTDAEFLADVSVHGSLVGGGDLGEVDLIGSAIFLDGFEGMNSMRKRTLWLRIWIEARKKTQAEPGS